MSNLHGGNLQHLSVMDNPALAQVCKTIEELEQKFRIQEGLLEFPKTTEHVYNAQLSIAADRPEEALQHMILHLR